MSHRGDTLPKRVARFEFWTRVRAWMGPKRWQTARVAYLASHEGGDASVLKALGLPAKQQMAADRDRKALAVFRDLHPDVPTHLGDVGNLPGQGTYDAMFLDFCGNVNDDTLAACVKASRLLRREDHSVFGVAVMRAREKGWKGRFEAAARRCVEVGRQHSQAHPEVYGTSPAKPGRGDDGRTAVIYEAIAADADRRNVAFYTMGKLTYRGVEPVELDAGKPGTPMVIVGYRSFCAPRYLSVAEFKSAGREQFIRNSALLTAWAARHTAAITGGAVQLPHCAIVGGEEGARLDRMVSLKTTPVVDFTGFEETSLLAEAVKWADEMGVDPALALNLSTTRVGALRAHNTRGTYTKRTAENWHRITDRIVSDARSSGVDGLDGVHVCGGDASVEAERVVQLAMRSGVDRVTMVVRNDEEAAAMHDAVRILVAKYGL